MMFKNWKIKAIAESSPDKEWQTRRVIHPQPSHFDISVLDALGKDAKWEGSNRYKVGEVVYIKEALYRHPYLDEAGYMLDQSPVFIKQTIGDCLKWRWRKDILTSMFMPQEAARYFITITDVRVERLQSITEEDAIAEGCDKEIMPGIELPSAKRRYSYLWDSINKPPYDWQSNPYVWVYSFKQEDK